MLETEGFVELTDGAFRARVPYHKARLLAIAGQVPAKRIGRSWWVEWQALAAWKREHDAEPSTAPA